MSAMTLVRSTASGPPPPPHQHPQMEGGWTRSGSARSSASGWSVNLEDIDEEEEQEEKVYVAVGKDVREMKENLLWLFKNTMKDKKIVFLHVHQPAHKIPTPLGKMPANQAQEQELRAFRKLEKEEMNKVLKQYTDSCKAREFRASTAVTENDDVAKGIIELIKKHQITDLVMGAAADKHLGRTKKARTPKSRTAVSVQQRADPSCRIRFVRKGELLCTREAGQDGQDTGELSRSSSSSSSSHSGQLRYSQSLPPPTQADPVNIPPSLNQRSKSVITSYSSIGGKGLTAPVCVGSPNLNYQIDPEAYDVRSYRGSSHKHADSEFDDESVNFNSFPPSPYNNMTDNVYARLKEALLEVEKLKTEAYEESMRRQKAERELLESNNQLRTEMKKRMLAEEKLEKESHEVEKHAKQHDQLINELKKADQHRSSLQLKIINLDRMVKDMEDKVSETNKVLETLKLERDNAIHEADKLRGQNVGSGSRNHGVMNYTEFTYLELKEATDNFDKSLKIGEGGYGSVYKGFLRHTTVAIKMLNNGSVQGETEFNQEIDILSRVRHPNLVTLIGACRESRALVYEFLPQGSLEDRLTCKNRTRPLTWQARVRIASEICCALIFLHQTKPQCIVHGDLKPDNILLDPNHTSKLSDFGICRQLFSSNTTATPYHRTENPRGTLAYMDPEYLSSGELTPQYDVYSFGIVLLRLVTGKEARGLRSIIEEAEENRMLDRIVDPSAGGWPVELAKKMAELGLRCSNPARRRRPDLATDVWREINSMVLTASSSMRRSLSEPSAFGLEMEASSSVPTYFICPLSKEIMLDPQIATDGFTYEARKIRDWFNQGNDTSPVTGAKLESFKLIPNLTLRNAIREWLKRHNDLL